MSEEHKNSDSDRKNYNVVITRTNKGVQNSEIELVPESAACEQKNYPQMKNNKKIEN